MDQQAEFTVEDSRSANKLASLPSKTKTQGSNSLGIATLPQKTNIFHLVGTTLDNIKIHFSRISCLQLNLNSIELPLKSVL
ncbi:hypothetical protein ACJIZ3_022015 [Penstemon smallii]|uniref:Uncharacterized protein n=1 Tax=Penstemon smallii TaxID=265156 RepID=A0ABD3SNR1_9LAMI